MDPQGGQIRYLSANIQFTPYGNRSVVLSHLASGRRIVASRDLAEILAACARPRTLDEHASFVANHVRLSAATPHDALPAVLSSLVDAGFLACESALVSACRTKVSATDHGAPLRRIVIPTLGRPAVLQRCLDSVGEQLSRYGHREIRVLVLDDSRDEASAATCTRLVSQAAAKHAVSIQRLSVEAAATHIAAGVSSELGIPEILTQFALRGDPACARHLGAVRNLALLLSPEGVLYLDDDIEFRAFVGREAEPELRLLPGRDPAQFRFFREPDAVRAHATHVELDLCAAIQASLGQTLPSCVNLHESAVSIEGLDDRFERGLRGGPSRVLRVSPGILGDAGSESVGFFFVDPSVYPDVFASEETYRATVESRLVWRCSPTPSLSTTASLMGGNAAFDHRETLPPFFPVERASDFLFGKMVNAVRADAVSAYVPWATAHWPDKQRRTPFAEIWDRLSGMDIANVVDLALEGQPRVVESIAPREKLDRLGRYFQDIGSQPTAEFEDQLRQRAYAGGGSQIASIESRLARPDGLPDYYLGDLRQYLQTVVTSQTREDYLVPRDVAQTCGAERARELSRELVGRFGDVLRAWPALEELGRTRADTWLERLAG